MNKIVTIVLVQIIPIVTAGALTINEIMYDPQGSDTGREWIEIFNETSGDVDLSLYKFFESNTRHSLSLFQGGTTTPPGGYAIIADTPLKFLIDYPSYNGIIFDSTFSLSNAGEYIALEDGSGNTLDSVTYSPASGGGGDGTTLSLFGSSWGRGNATGGETNVVATSSTSTPSTLSVAKMSAPLVDLTMVLPEERIVMAGAPADFSVRGLTSQGTSPTGLVYNWAFGDGGEGKGRSVAYRYHYPGMYIATVEGDNGFISALGKMRVRVVAPEVSIKNVIREGDAIGFDIENKTGYELDVSGWKIAVNGMGYPLPRNTFISGKSVTRINGNALFIGTSTLPSTTTLMFPDGMMFTASQFFGVSTSTEIFSLNDKSVDKKLKQAEWQTVQAVQTKRQIGIDQVVAGTKSNLPYTATSGHALASTSLKGSPPTRTKDSRVVSFFKNIFGTL